MPTVLAALVFEPSRDPSAIRMPGASSSMSHNVGTALLRGV